MSNAGEGWSARQWSAGWAAFRLSPFLQAPTADPLSSPANGREFPQASAGGNPIPRPKPGGEGPAPPHFRHCGVVAVLRRFRRPIRLYRFGVPGARGTILNERFSDDLFYCTQVNPRRRPEPR
ncbi:hypothetical protein GCM10010430_71030 [Kitasatospora cystarginea]|uniref:Uncharacterized protein n=1 Tax=Kitasatospora cystarginea TaxID=58350 RepID=A0ABP5RXC5_9ACTN